MKKAAPNGTLSCMSVLPPPTYEDAALILRLYDLRREEKLRAAREWFRVKFWPKTIDDVKAVSTPRHPENANFRMVISYWDMAASFVAQGVLHPELFLESSGEMLFVWAKLEPFIEPMRKEMPALLKNVDAAIQKTPSASTRLQNVRQRLVKVQEALQQA